MFPSNEIPAGGAKLARVRACVSAPAPAFLKMKMPFPGDRFPSKAAYLVAFGVTALRLAASAEEPPSPEHLAFFESKVRPVLVEHCYKCHSAEAEKEKKLKGDLFVDTREGLMTGGESGPALVPGKPAESLLMKLIHENEMPPKNKLPASAVADLTKWIEMGAPDPRVGGTVAKAKRSIDVVEGKQWWAFKALSQPAVPPVKNTAWVRTPIDAFILAKQESAALQPNGLATPEKLLRRATFNLIGLAPTVEEREAFLKDASPDAYERLIDRLLSSPRYGERWGRHWLDVVRYAESGGYEFDGFRPGAYHYRDWVIKALNEDMPFDEFVRMQLAGDKLKPNEFDGARATGFLVAGPYPGQTTVKTQEKIRYDQLDDMVSTIGSGFLGLTMACVRCHDHKFDPLPQQDYYGIAAALATTVHAASKLDPVAAETQRKLAEHEAAGAPLLAALKKFEAEELPGRFGEWREKTLPTLPADAPWQILDVQSVTAQAASLTADRDGHVRYVDKKAKDDLYTVKAVTYQKGVKSFRLDALSDATFPAKGPGLSDNGNFVLGDVKIIARPVDPKDKTKPVTLKLKAVKATFEQKDFPLSAAVDNNPGSGWAVSPEIGKDHAALFAIDGEPIGFEGGTELEVQLRFSGHFGLGKMRLAFSNAATEAKLEDKEDLQHQREIATVVSLKNEQGEEAKHPSLMRWFSRFDPRAQELVSAITEHERKRPAPVLTEVYTAKDGGGDVHFLPRGEVDRKQAKVNPAFVQVLMRADAETKWLPKPAPPQPPVHPRIALANWMTDAEVGGGPLLARVIVNRLWRQHFGRGIVATTNDFGSQGEKPTHPELLEWLAAELVRNGWQLKPIHRLIMRSAVYLQSGDVNEANVQRDPNNHLWAQRPPRRLEAEAIRDALLQAGGKLDATMFGPPEADYESARRSVYLRVKRSELVPFMTMFDAPEPTQSVGDRGGTTVPTQALASLNSKFVRDMASRLYDRVQATKPDTIETAIQRTYELAFSRAATDGETQRMKSFVDAQTEMLGNKPDSPAHAMREFCHAVLCLNEFIYVD